MKRRGQWIFLLWIAAALLCPQVRVQPSAPRDNVREWSTSRTPAPTLVAVFSSKTGATSEAGLAQTSDDLYEFDVVPDVRPHAALTELIDGLRLPAAPEIRSAHIRLPLERGPPACA